MGVSNAPGRVPWTWGGSGRACSLGYFVTWNDSAPTITLHYRWRDTENVRIPVGLETSRTNFNGRRGWFTCPLIVRGFHCRRRAEKPYLPTGAKYFGCRVCHNLTYKSAQEAHQGERVFARLGFGPEQARMLGGKWFWKDRF